MDKDKTNQVQSHICSLLPNKHKRSYSRYVQEMYAFSVLRLIDNVMKQFNDVDPTSITPEEINLTLLAMPDLSSLIKQLLINYFINELTL